MADEAKKETRAPLGKPKKGPLEMAEFHYNLKTMYLWLFATSLVLIFSCVGAVVQDHFRPWKEYQRVFTEIERERARKELKKAELKLKSEQGELEKLRTQRRKAEDEARKRKLAFPGDVVSLLKNDLAAIEKEAPAISREMNSQVTVLARQVNPVLAKLERGELGADEYKDLRDSLSATHYGANLNFGFIVAEYGEKRWQFEHYQDLYRHEAKGEYEQKMREAQKQLEQVTRTRDLLRRMLELVEKLVNDLTARMDEINAPVREVDKRIALKEKDVQDAQKKVDLLTETITVKIRNFPGLDFYGPTLKVRQQWLTSIYEDITFAVIPKVDRCTTCHLGIDNPAYQTIRDEQGHLTFKDPEVQKIFDTEFKNEEDREMYTKMFMAHPNLEYFVLGSSPHPIEKFGCTICHEGDGRETDFSYAVHTPRNEQQEKQWQRRYGYHRRSYAQLAPHQEHQHVLWDYPMYTRDNIYASCRKCHTQEVELEAGGQYNEGMVLFERAGCYACHKTDTYPVLDKHLPQLANGWDVEAFKIERSTDGVIWSQVGSVPGTALKFSDGSVSPGTTYYYRVVAWNAHGYSNPSQSANVTTKGAKKGEAAKPAPLPDRPTSAAAPVTPTGVSATAVSETRVDLTWSYVPVDKSKRMRRPGPPLTHVADKFSEDWAVNWVLSPRAYRPTTRMPHFFRQSNARSVTTRDGTKFAPAEVEDVQAAAIVKYLFSRSDSRAYPDVPAQGDVRRGEELVNQVGCIACHRIDEKYDSGQVTDVNSKFSPYKAEFGPNLSGIGEKVNKKWLFQWLKNPRHYMPQTRMPSLRLTDQEAADISEFLMTLKINNSERQIRGLDRWKPEPVKINDKLLEHLVYEQLRAKLPEIDTQVQLQALKAKGQMVNYLGQRLVSYFGCYSCHDMKSDRDLVAGSEIDWRSMEGIGTELTGSQPWGSKFVDRLDFGKTVYDGINHHGVKFINPSTGKPYLHKTSTEDPTHVRIRHTRHDFAVNKLLDPRIYDGGLLESKPPDELLRMPNFNFTRHEAEAIATFIQSMTFHEDRKLVRDIRKTMSPVEQLLNRGKRIVRDYNCSACHIMQADRFLVEHKERDDKGRELTRREWVEGKFFTELSKDETVQRLKNWNIEPTAEVHAPRLLQYQWTFDGRTQHFPQAVNPNAQFVYYDGRGGWFYLDTTVSPPVKKRILKHLPQEGGEYREQINAYKVARGFDPVKDVTKLESLYPPMLRAQGVKTQPDWLFRFLKNPTPIRTSLLKTLELPTVHKEFDAALSAAPDADDIDQEAESLLKKAAALSADVRKVVEEELKKWRGTSFTNEDQKYNKFVQVVTGLKLAIREPGINVRMPTFQFTDEEAWSLVKYFWARDHVPGVDEFPAPHSKETDPAYLATRTAQIQEAKKYIVENCAKCHRIDGQDPPKGMDVTYGPELGDVHARFNPRWLYPWLRTPSQMYPGTAMTGFYDNKEELLKSSIEYLMNYHKYKGQ